VVITQDDKGRPVTNLTSDAVFSLASLSADQLKAIDAVLHAGYLSLAAQIGASVSTKELPADLRDKIAYRDGVVFVQKKLKEAFDKARDHIKYDGTKE